MRTFQRVARLIRPAIALPILAGLGLVGLLILSQGCGNPKTLPLNEVYVNPSVPDLPIPTGTKFSTNGSYQYLTGGVRNVRHYYETEWSIREIAAFYRAHMPEYGWAMKEDNLSSGTQRFVFSKGGETCYVSIWDSWGVKLLLQVLPTGVRPSEPAARPVAPKK